MASASELCENKTCGHQRCRSCINITNTKWHLQYRDEFIVEYELDAAEALLNKLTIGLDSEKYFCALHDAMGCDKSYASWQNANGCALSHLIATDVIPCTFPGCQRQFARQDKWRVHLQTHCDSEGLGSAFQKMLQSDLPEREPSLPAELPGGMYTCPWYKVLGCSNTYRSVTQAERHGQDHLDAKLLDCTFPGCQKTYFRVEDARKHLKSHYENVVIRDPDQNVESKRLYPCRFKDAIGCNKAFKSKSASNRHSRSHLHQQLPCPYPGCRKEFPDSNAVMHHLPVHTEVWQTL